MAEINQNKCMGCGICTNICLEGIEMINGKARIKNENAKCLKDAANACPSGAIVLDNMQREPIQDHTQGRGMGAGSGRGLGIGPRDGRGRGRGGGGRRWNR